MKKKIKRISKMVMTIVLTATMLFGQLPSGLVLVANADTISGNGNSTLPDMSAGAAKYFNPDNGGSQIGDPKSLPDEEETSEEDESEEDESETSSIEEESDSSKKKAEVNSEKEIQSEEKTSEEKTSESAKQDVKDALDEDEDVMDGDPDPNPEPGPTPVDLPEISVKDGAALYREYSTDLDFSVDPTLFDVNAPSEAEYSKDVYRVTYSLDVEDTTKAPEVGDYSVQATVTLDDNYQFKGEGDKTERVIDIEGVIFTINPQKVDLNSIIVGWTESGEACTRAYQKGNTDLPAECVVKYYFTKNGSDPFVLDSAGGISFSLESDSVEEGFKKLVPELGGFTPGDNYLLNPLPEELPVFSNVKITKKEVFVVFAQTVTKQNNGLDASLPSLDNNSFMIENESGENESGVEVRLNDGEVVENWMYSSTVPSNGISIIGVNDTDFSIWDNNDQESDLTTNYKINVSELKGNITPRKKNQEEYNLDLTSIGTNEPIDISGIEEGLSISFNQMNYRKDEQYWFGFDNGTQTQLTATDVTFYSYDADKNTVNQTELNFIPSNSDNENHPFENIVLKKEDTFYGPIKAIRYNYDNVKPYINNNLVTTNVGPKKKNKQYSIDTEHVNDRESTSVASGIAVSGLFKIVNTTPFSLEDIVNDEYDGKTPSESQIITQSEAGQYNIWIYARDYAGNRSLDRVNESSLDGNDPVISIAVDSDEKQIVNQEIAGNFNEKDYLSELSFKLYVTDDKNLDTGLKSVKIYLLDGTDNVVKYDEQPIENNCNGSKQWTSAEYVFDSSKFGYQLHFLIEAEDNNQNKAYAKAYWKSEGLMQLDTVEDGNITPETAQVDLEETFAIVGEGENSPEISVDFDDNDSYVREYDGAYYFSSQNRTATVNFKNMAISSVIFANESGVLGNNNNSFGLEYTPSKHAYEYKGSGSNWSFSSRPEAYSISLSSKKPNFVSLNLSDCNKKFVVNHTKANVNIVMGEPTVSLHDEKYYSFTGDQYVEARVTLTGDNLPNLADIEDYVYVEYENNPTYQNYKDENDWVKWTGWSGSATDGYTASFYFREDGISHLKVWAANLLNNPQDKNSWEFKETGNFIIDNTAPTFDIKYQGATNVINDTYYYGLEDGINTEKPTNINVEITFTEANIFENDVFKDGVVEVYKNNEVYVLPVRPVYNGETKPNDKTNQTTYSFSIPGIKDGENDGSFKVNVKYSDPVGNLMVSVNKEGSNQKKFEIVDGVYDGCERTDIIDTIQPVATYSITPLGKDESGKWIGHYEGDADYYKDTFSVKFAVEDDNYDDRYTKTAVVKEGVTSNNEMIYNSETKSFATTVNNAKANEGRYTFSITGIEDEGNVLGATDFAGNFMVFKNGEGTMEGTDPDPEQEGREIGKYTTGVKVLDITAPAVNLSISTDAKNQDLNKNFNNRFYFNKSFIGTFTIEELNYDSTKIAPVYGTTPSSQCENYTTKEAPSANIPFDSNSTSIDPKIFEQTFGKEKDGLYVLSLSGTDKAGNQVIRAKKGKDEIDYISSTNPITSYVFVVDTVMPTVTVEMNLTGKEDKFYKATLKEVTEGTTKNINYEFEENRPYQRKPENVSEIGATITFTEVDQLPTSLIYSIDSTMGGKNNYNSFEDYQWQRWQQGSQNNKASVSGKQIYWFKTIKIVDLAGNEIETAPTNKIYLDETPPNIENDTLAPLVEFVAKVSSTERGLPGNPLYKGDQNVRIQAKVHDNQGEESVIVGDKDTRISSSGLYKVYYKVTVNGNDVTDAVVLEEERAKASEPDGKKYVHYYTSGPDYNNTENKEDEKLTYDDTLTFKFPTKDGENGIFNHNNIVLTVWTVDNAGNEGKPSTYSFGIDTISPSISVSYNNNEVQNGKYFKDPRTATITVTERNFDGGRIHISTESSAHVSGWSYSKGDPNGNGDDDKWTATVVYDTDGDYTFGVSGSDLVNHGASVTLNGVAPTEFTIDLTKPVIAVAFDNNRVANGRYYNANRRATIDITEHNFDAKDATVERTAAIAEGTVAVPGIGNWARINDINRNEVYFGQDGDYTMKVDYVDLAGNIAETYVVDLFTIDTVAPELEIGGVEDKHAYNGKVAPSMTYHDINFDKNSAKLDIVGNKNKGDNSWDRHPTDERFGGGIVCDSIQEVRDNDDIYTAKASISDLAGNTTEKQVTFSVNRFGSTYIISDSTQKFLDKYYNQQGETLEITEINVNELASYGVTYSVDGNTSHNIVEGEEFTVQQAHDGDGWWEYNYRISGPKNFTDEGNYLVELKSRDGAANDNGNRFIQKTVSETYELPIEFVIDHSAPTLVMTGVENGGSYRADERTVMIRYEDSVTFLKNLKVYEGDKLVQEYDQKQLSEAGGEIQYQAKASNRKQEIRLEAVDMAGNQGKLSSGQFLLTSNAFIQFVNNTPLLIAAIAGLVLLFGGIIFLVIMLTRRKRY